MAVRGDRGMREVTGAAERLRGRECVLRGLVSCHFSHLCVLVFISVRTENRIFILVFR